MNTMTPEQRMARAHEIFDYIYDTDEKYAAQHALDTAKGDLSDWIIELEEHIAPDSDSPPWFSIEHIVKEFRSIVETLDSIDLTEGQ